MIKKSRILNLTNIFLLFLSLCFLLLLRWNSFDMPYERDEGEYAYSAWILRQGIFPYENSFLQKPPMIIYTYFLGQIISSVALWPARLFAFLAVFLTALVLGFAAGKRYGFWVGWAVVFLIELTLSFPYFTALASNTEIFMIFFLTLVFSLYFYYQAKASYLILFLSGFFSSISLFYKPVSVFPLFLIYLAWIYEIYQKKHLFSEVIKSALFAFLGFLVASCLILLPFLIFGRLGFLEETVIDFNFYYGKVWEKYGLSGFYLQMGKLIRVWWLVLLPFFVFLFSSVSHKKLILGLVLFSLFASFRTTIGHYYLIIMPFLSLAVVLGLWKIYLLFFKNKDFNFFLFFSLFLALLIFPLRKQFALTPQELSEWIYGFENPFVESSVLAQKIIQNSSPQDFIFVAGSEPQIYFYSKRSSPTRFVITYPLNIYSPKREEYQREVIKDLQEKRPKLIVYSKKPTSGFWEEGSPKILFDYISQEINENYNLISVCYMDFKGPVCKDYNNGSDLNNVSFLLYKLKYD